MAFTKEDDDDDGRRLFFFRSTAAVSLGEGLGWRLVSAVAAAAARLELVLTPRDVVPRADTGG